MGYRRKKGNGSLARSFTFLPKNDLIALLKCYLIYSSKQSYPLVHLFKNHLWSAKQSFSFCRKSCSEKIKPYSLYAAEMGFEYFSDSNSVKWKR